MDQSDMAIILGFVSESSALSFVRRNMEYSDDEIQGFVTNNLSRIKDERKDGKVRTLIGRFGLKGSQTNKLYSEHKQFEVPGYERRRFEHEMECKKAVAKEKAIRAGIIGRLNYWGFAENRADNFKVHNVDVYGSDCTYHAVVSYNGTVMEVFGEYNAECPADSTIDMAGPSGQQLAAE